MYQENFNHSIIQTVSQLPKANLSITRLGIVFENTVTGSRGTFEFPSRVNLSGPGFYSIARTLGK